jgi:DNA-binding CsgD family transcriptional regulator
VALGRRAGPAPDRFLVAAGALSLLAEAAEQQPLLVLLDDVQWLDQPSAEALGFVARRLAAERIALLIAVRDGEPHSLGDGVPSHRIAGLTDAEAQELLSGTPNRLAARVADRLVEQSDGNPLALVEVPRLLTAGQASGVEPLPDPLPVGDHGEELFAGRLDGLGHASGMITLIAAAEEHGDLAVIEAAAAAMGLDLDALQPAERVGLVQVDGRVVRFRHPLARSAAYYRQPVSHRQAAHRALGVVLASVDTDRAAWHRAAATTGADERAARAMERVGQRASGRAAFATASTAFERAAQLSRHRPDHRRRTLASAEAAWRAGNVARAQVLVDRLRSADSASREAMLLQGFLHYTAGRPTEAFDDLLVAMSGPDGLVDRGLLTAVRTSWTISDPSRLARLRAELGPSIQGFPGNLLAGAEALLRGHHQNAVVAMRRAAQEADGTTDITELAVAASLAAFTGDQETARRLAARAEHRGRARGDVAAMPLVLYCRGFVHALDGWFDRAMSLTDEAVRLAYDMGQPYHQAHTSAIAALVAAVRGDRPEYERHHGVAQTLAGDQLSSTRALTRWGEGLWALGAGRADQACTLLLTVTGPGGHPIVGLLSAADLAEAAARSGRPDDGAEPLAALRAWSREAGTPIAAALAARAEGVLADDPGLLEQALALLEGLDRPFDQARAHLLLGEHLRRDRRRAAARRHLRAAADHFDQLGAEPWSRRAGDELRASGESLRHRAPGERLTLTPQEHKIARMVADGITNREIAAQLFLSPRTVDYHLRNVFAKLDISSRAELIRHPP